MTDKLTSADLDRLIADRALPSCHGACNQGRVPCPVPDACQLSDAEYDFAVWRGLALGIALVAAFAVVALLIAASL